MTLPADLLGRMNAWWRAANYLSAGQIYLLDNPLLRRPLVQSDVKPRLLGHWGTTPGLNFVYVYLNRIIRQQGAELLFIAGPGDRVPTRGVATALLSRVSCSIRLPMPAG